MPPRARQKPAAVEVDQLINSLLDKVERVPVGSLTPHPKNPNQGNVDLVAKSLQFNGQFKPIVVQKSNRVILAGNHTWLGARKLGWSHIDVVFVDVDDDRGLRILLMDNKSSDERTYDEDVLAEILSHIATTEDSLEGTGFSQAEFEKLAAEAAVLTDELASDAEADQRAMRKAELDAKKAKTFDGARFGEEPDPDDDEDLASELEDDEDEPSGPDVRNAEEKLPGMMQFKDPGEVNFETVGYWNITKLRRDKLMAFADLPDNLETWAGSATRDWPDEDVWWLYNYGVDSTSGMKDISHVILGFYTDDKYFENWWNYPERFAAKLVNSGIKYAITPNYSQWPDDPHVYNLWNMHRSRWVGRYLQEAGIDVIPDVNWPAGDESFLTKHVLPTLPRNPPMIAMQLQTFEPEKAEEFKLKDMYEIVLDTLKPEGVLFYAGGPGQQFWRENMKTDIPVRILDTRQSKLSVKAKDRKRKTTI